ncbi:MAG: hypothetical protein DRP01_10125 [Archaeoglobales archaeon]|nr:MAG: hypothetical protein DRP01_10125 [Archaeoglobales archaeon]
MEEVQIPEKDKPFILAIISVGVTILNICVVAYGAVTGNQQMVDSGIEMLKFTFPLTTMAWTFYFKARS